MPGWQDEAKAAALEADYIHNLPGLLCKFSQRNLKYYWRNERADYLRKRLEFNNSVLPFEDLCTQLKNVVPYLGES